MFYAPSSGGVRRYLLEKRAWLRRARPEVRHSVIVPGADDGPGEEGLSFVRARALPGCGGYRIPLRRGAWVERLVAEAPDLIEAGDPYVPGFAAREAGRRLGVPVIGFCHSDLAALAGARFGAWSASAAQAVMARLCDGFDLLIAPSQTTAHALRAVGFDRVAAAPLGVDLETFRPRPTAQARQRADLGLKDGETLLVFAGRPAAEKRVPVLVDTVRLLGPSVKLLLIGCGEAITPDPQVLVRPFEPDARRLAISLGCADALIHANPAETLGLIALEAMACATPVIGVGAGGIGEVVCRAAGELSETADATGLARAARRLFERGPRAVGKTARAHVARLYSWDAAFDRLSGLYFQLTGLEGFRTAA